MCFHNWKIIFHSFWLQSRLPVFHMDNYISGEDTDDDFDIQLTIQQSLQSLQGPGTAQQPPADERWNGPTVGICHSQNTSVVTKTGERVRIPRTVI